MALLLLFCECVLHPVLDDALAPRGVRVGEHADGVELHAGNGLIG
jgi:hypothetical protein